MKRKTIQVSRCTQLISLPRKWIINNNVKKGTELDVDEEDNKMYSNNISNLIKNYSSGIIFISKIL